MSTTIDSITAPLKRKFDKHRIVFWYDENEELRKEFEAVELDAVEKIEIKNNEFGIKYRVLREQPDQNFLIYKSGPQPADSDNWLLDVQLASDTFRTDRISQTLDELGLPIEFRELVSQHDFFFNAARRKLSLQRLLNETDTENQVRMKMLAVCAGSDARLDSALENLLSEDADDSTKTERFDLIAKCELTGFLWEQMRRTFNYSSNQPGIRDFVIELFKSCYAMGTDGPIRLGTEAMVFLKRWMDSYSHRESFENHSQQCAEILRIQDGLQNQQIKQLIDLDYFKLIDQKILSELIKAVLAQTMSAGECKQIVRSRRNTHWYQDFADIYETIEHAAQLINLLSNLQINFQSLSQGVASYTQSYYAVDYAYRKFLYHYRKSNQNTLLSPLYEQICNQYSNGFLLQLCDKWQSLVDQADAWDIPNSIPQRKFFSRFVKPFLDKNKKIFVIISDALRFEIGEELCGIIKQEDRYDAELDHMITGLPSYTQLGMASLLPNSQIEINDDKTSTVSVDGVSSQGTKNRDKILKDATKGRALAIQANEFLQKTTEECRELTREHDLIYLYHNNIDKTGHDRSTERQVFDATESALEELIKVVKKLTNANANNLIITSDHGFIYQDEVGESDFSSADPHGQKILNKDRRFVIGQGLEDVDGINVYDAAKMGLGGELQVMIPKSINRFRQRGAAIRFVHGGCTLQEVIVPVIQIRKGRTSDQAAVNVDMLPSATNVISAGQLAAVFYQADAVSEKIRPRYLRIGLFAPDGMSISDSHDLSFDFESENPREREQKIRLVLSKLADSYNGQQVTLRLDEPVAGTSHFREYKSFVYTLRRSFTSDFDL